MRMRAPLCGRRQPINVITLHAVCKMTQRNDIQLFHHLLCPGCISIPLTFTPSILPWAANQTHHSWHHELLQQLLWILWLWVWRLQWLWLWIQMWYMMVALEAADMAAVDHHFPKDMDFLTFTEILPQEYNIWGHKRLIHFQWQHRN